MNKMNKGILAVMFLLAFGTAAQAGNPDRAGSAGTAQLLVNPWARSSGLSFSNMASSKGVEAIFSNVAGLYFVDKLDINFCTTNYLVGADIKVNALGFAKKIGESSVLGVSLMSMNFGNNTITEEETPEGGIGEFAPVYSNIALSYAKEFSNSIYGGITMRIISESISNAKAQGVALDAGIRYVTGERDHVRFGIALKNVGPPMKYTGDGLSFSAIVNGNGITLEQRTVRNELPTLVNIGFAYDFLLSENMLLTTNGQFISNSFINDQYSLGAEFNLKDRFFLRGGYLFEGGAGQKDTDLSVFSGPSAGLSVDFNAGETAKIGFDYSYQATTNQFSGIHSIGLHIEL